MLSGRTPYQAESTVTLMMMVLNDPLPDLREIRKGISDSLLAVVEKALEKDLKDRFQTMDEMAAALQGAQEQVASPQPTPPEALSLKEQCASHLQQAYHLDDAKIALLLAKSAELLSKDLQWFNGAWQGQDFDTLHQASHKIKGALLNLGLNEQAALAAKVESAAEDKASPPGQEIINDLSQAIAELANELAST